MTSMQAIQTPGNGIVIEYGPAAPKRNTNINPRIAVGRQVAGVSGYFYSSFIVLGLE